jgi:hypothetical protein
MNVGSGNGRSCRVCADPPLNYIEAALVQLGTNRRAAARKHRLADVPDSGFHPDFQTPKRADLAAQIGSRTLRNRW